MLAYVIFLLYLRPTTLKGNPSKLRSHFGANSKILSKQNHTCASTDIFFCLKSCKFEKFVVPLQAEKGNEE